MGDTVIGLLLLEGLRFCPARPRAKARGRVRVLRAGRCLRALVALLLLGPVTVLWGSAGEAWGLGFAAFFLLLLLPLLNEAFGTTIWYDDREVGYASWFRKRRWPWRALVRLETSPGAEGVYLVFEDGGYLAVPRYFDGAAELLERAKARLAALKAPQ